MATFNGGRFLKKQLETLARQTTLPAELVISDDGSTDETIAIAQAFAEVAPFPVHIRQNSTRTGYRTNFMNAALLCTSDLIAFCDQDDLWHEQKLAAVVEAFHDTSVLLVHHNAQIIDANEAPIGLLLQPDAHIAVSDPLTIDPWVFALGFCQVFRRTLLDFSSLREQSIDFYFPQEHLAHDQWFFFLASVLGRIVYLPRDLVDYRQHGGNAYGVQANKLARLLTKIRQKMNNSGSFYEHLAIVARNRVMILDHIATTSGDNYDHAIAGSERYNRLAERLEERARIYGVSTANPPYATPFWALCSARPSN
jgi:glycosyltransferase involved in cell wall biosynthesis